jgi:hypothetical protein
METKRGDIERKRGRESENETNNEEREKRRERGGRERGCRDKRVERERWGGNRYRVGVRVGGMKR